MKILLTVILLCVGSLVLLSPLGLAGNPKVQPETRRVDLEVFVRDGCPHCEAAKTFLEKLRQENLKLHILFHDVGHSPEALKRLTTLAARQGVKQLGVPTFYLRGKLIVGYISDETTGKQLKNLLGRPPPRTPTEHSDGICTFRSNDSCDKPVPSNSLDSEDIDFPFLGRHTLQDLGLPLFTILLGLLDGFNPCAMWVLLFLLSLLATLRDRRKMIILAFTFVLVSGLVYFTFMAAWFNVFLLIGYSRFVQLLLGSVAIIIGGIHVKDFMAFRHGISLGIPESMKPTLYERLRQIIRAPHIHGALIGIITLAVLVNFVELACTAGFPAMYTRILSQHAFSLWQYYGYLGLYNLAYMADDAVMVTIAVVTLSHHKLQEREGRWLKLLGGIVMMGLGLWLILVPEKML